MRFVLSIAFVTLFYASSIAQINYSETDSSVNLEPNFANDSLMVSILNDFGYKNHMSLKEYVSLVEESESNVSLVSELRSNRVHYNRTILLLPLAQASGQGMNLTCGFAGCNYDRTFKFYSDLYEMKKALGYEERSKIEYINWLHSKSVSGSIHSYNEVIRSRVKSTQTDKNGENKSSYLLDTNLCNNSRVTLINNPLNTYTQRKQLIDGFPSSGSDFYYIFGDSACLANQYQSISNDFFKLIRDESLISRKQAVGRLAIILEGIFVLDTNSLLFVEQTVAYFSANEEVFLSTLDIYLFFDIMRFLELSDSGKLLIDKYQEHCKRVVPDRFIFPAFLRRHASYLE